MTTGAGGRVVGSGWSHAMCEVCWIHRRGHRNARGVPTRVDKPVRLREPELERCCYCSSPTIFGVYVRDDPAATLCQGAADWGPIHRLDA